MAKKSTLVLVSALALAGCLSGTSKKANEKNVPLTIQNTSKVSYPNWPMTTGVPFKKLALTSNDKMALFEREKEIPLQEKTTSLWAPNGSTRWKLIDFQAKLNGSTKQELDLEYGKGLKVCEPEKKISVYQNEDSIKISTGIFTYSISRKKFNIFEYVKENNGQTIYDGNENSGPYVINEKGELFTASYGTPDKVEIENKGLLRTVVKAEGWHYSKSGEKFCRYIVRINFYASQPFVRIYHTFLITESSDKAKFKDIGVNFSFDAKKVAFGGSGKPETILDKEKTKYLLQYDSDKFAVSENGETPKWGDIDGKRASGWVQAKSDDASILLAVKDFWQQFPKELEAIGGKGITFHAWPEHGISKPERKVEDAMIQYLWFCHEGDILDFNVPKSYWSYKYDPKEKKTDKLRYLRSSKNANVMGLAKTHELLLGFNIKSPKKQNAILTLFQKPPTCMASPEWMCESGIFGKIHPYDPKRFPKIEKALSKVFDCEMRLMDYTNDYGMFNFGDGHTSWDHGKKRWNDVYRCWRALHHGAPRVPWLLYFRSGDPKYFRRAVRNAQHVMDIDICHFTTPELEGKKYPHQKIVGALNDYKGIVHWHAGGRLMDYNSMTDFLLYDYYMTGNRRARDVANEWGESVKKRYGKPFGSRSGAGVCAATIEMYKATFDPRYKEIADKQANYMFDHVQNMDNTKVYSNQTISYWPELTNKVVPYGAFPEWENYAPWAERYLELTNDKRTKERILKWADAYIAGYGDLSSFWRQEYLNIMAYAYFISKDPKYLAHGLRCMNKYINKIKDEPGDLYDGSIDGGMSSHEPGYMAQRIPYFLSALAEYGKPVEEEVPPVHKNFKLLYKLIANPQRSRITEAFLLEEKDIPFKIHITGYARGNKIQAILMAQDGKEILNQDLLLKRGETKFTLNVPSDGKKGINKLVLKGLNGYWRLDHEIKTDPSMKQVFAYKGATLRSKGCRYFFYVPAQVKEIKITSSNGFFAVLDSHGKAVKQFNSNNSGGAIIPEKSEKGKLWSLQGEFGKYSSLDIKGVGGKIPQYISVKPELFFNPDSCR